MCKQESGVVGVDGVSSEFPHSAASLPKAAVFSFPALEKAERGCLNRNGQKRRASDEATENRSVGKTTAAWCTAQVVVDFFRSLIHLWICDISIVGIATIGVPVIKRSARQIATGGIYTIILRASILRNCFLRIPCGICHEDYKSTIFLDRPFTVFPFSIRVWNYSASYYLIRTRNKNIHTPLPFSVLFLSMLTVLILVCCAPYAFALCIW